MRSLKQSSHSRLNTFYFNSFSSWTCSHVSMAESFLFSQKSQGFIVKVITEADLGRWKLYNPLVKKAVLWAITKKNTCSCIGVTPTLNIRMNTVDFCLALVSLSSQLLLQGLLTSILVTSNHCFSSKTIGCFSLRSLTLPIPTAWTTLPEYSLA